MVPALILMQQPSRVLVALRGVENLRVGTDVGLLTLLPVDHVMTMIGSALFGTKLYLVPRLGAVKTQVACSYT
jgi:hypothetical protein